MNCDIFIRSYRRDFPWLIYCLNSIKKYCRGFRKVILVVPESSSARVTPMRFPCDKVFVCRNYKDDYLGQQITKLFADTFTDADYICHVDSDCIFYRTITPHNLFQDGKVQILMAPYHKLARSTPWRTVTEKFLKRNVEYEFMQRQPHTFPRWLYEELRAHAHNLHGTKVESYIIGQPHRGFSEFNAMGAYAYYNHSEKFSWLDIGSSESRAPICKWYWSWGGIERKIEEEICGILE
jgi:Family of unknown function (DUF6492)